MKSINKKPAETNMMSVCQQQFSGLTSLHRNYAAKLYINL